MGSETSREWRFKSRPVGLPKHSDFELATVKLADPAEGEIRVRNHWMTVDPYMRGRMNEAKSYAPGFELGQVMTGGAVGEVVASRDPNYKPGDLVTSMAGWREVFQGPAASVGTQKLPPYPIPQQAYLGVAGMPGLTAYVGLLTLGQPKPGETVFVSGAAGAVGSIVCQIAKLKGCRVVASAGGADKVKWLKDRGVDEVIDYKALEPGPMPLIKAVRAAAPKGVDVYFDNVGGDHLTAAIDSANPMARMPICGMISVYNATSPPAGPFNMALIVGRQIKIQGFLVFSYFDQQAAFQKEMAGWIQSGQITYEETVMTGIEKAPDAFLALFSGGNTGKMLVKLA